ncbi:MAG: DUF1295 domain-containing protein [Pseudomonadota bacterium]
MELFIGLSIAVLFMLGLWQWQRASGRADYVDVAWSGLIGVLALLYAVLGDGSVEKSLLAAVVAGSWSYRLCTHLWIRLNGHDDEDGRYQAMREHFGDRIQPFFFGFFLFQGLLAWLFAMPAWVVASDPRTNISLWVIAGLAIWLISLVGETVADRQLQAFRVNPQNKGKVCQIGLWRYSRHPNYFFEWLHWFAYPLIALGAPNQWITWLGPVLMLLFLYRVTGIPYTEMQSLKSRGDAYRDYQRTTSALFPWPPKR